MKHPAFLVAAVGALAAVAACDGFKEAMTAHVDVVAKAGSQELSVERLAKLLGEAQIPLQREVAKSVASLWVDYQLLGVAAAKGDSLTDTKAIDNAMWGMIASSKMQKLGARVLASSTSPDTTNVGPRYDAGEALAARHILIKFPNPGQPTPPALKDSLRRRADALHAQATKANFADLARRNSGDEGSAARGGDLGVFPRGMMVPEFEKALVALKPGDISNVVESQFGYHIIYRPTYDEVKTQVGPLLGQRTRQVAESTYLVQLEQTGKVTVNGDAPTWIKAIAQDPESHKSDKKVLATSTAGDLTAGRVTQWLTGLPNGDQIRQQIGSAPDSVLSLFVRSLARNELLIKQADSLHITPDTAELTTMRRAFVSLVTTSWTGLGVSPAQLADSAKNDADRSRVASARVEGYLDRLLAQRAQFIQIPTPLETVLREKYSYTLNDAGIDRALERATQLRRTADSTRATQQPPTAVPLPGGATPPAGAPSPAGARSPAPTTQPPANQPAPAPRP